MESYNIKLQAYQLPGFKAAIDEYNKYYLTPISANYFEQPMDDDGVIFYEVRITIHSNPTALLYLGKFWKS